MTADQLEESYRAGLEAGKVYTAKINGTLYTASPAEPNALFNCPHFYMGPERISSLGEGNFTVSSKQAARWMSIMSEDWTQEQS